MIQTITLEGDEVKIEGLGGKNTVISNRGSSTVYASAFPDIEPNNNNVATIPSGGVMNLSDTNGTVYLLGTGKVQLMGTNSNELPMSALIASGSGGGSGGGGSTGGVSQEYVENADALTLNAAKKYTDEKIDEVRGEIPDSLPADGGDADTANKLNEFSVQRPGSYNGKPFWVKFAESQFTTPAVSAMLKCVCHDAHAYKGIYPGYSDEFYGCYDILFRYTGTTLERAEIQWEYLSGAVNPDDVVLAYYIDDDGIYHLACFVNLMVSWTGMSSSIMQEIYNKGNQKINLLKNFTGTETIPAEYTTIIPSTIMPLRGISDELSDLKAYVGYTDSDIYGLEADFENNKFTRLAGAVGKSAGADFDSINAFGGRKRCSVSEKGEVIAYYGETYYDDDGTVNIDNHNIIANAMVEQPKFYYKVVPLKIEKIDGTDGYHLRKARYYISDTPKPGFKVHPAFIQNNREIDFIYFSTYEAGVRDTSAKHRLMNDEQIVNFDEDVFMSTCSVKPTSGTTQALTRANAKKLAQNIGSGWGITTIQTLSATQLLFAIEYATFNSQTAIGNGVVNVTETIKTGSTSSLGNTSGSVASGGVSYRGEENLWGNIYNLIDGAECINQTPIGSYGEFHITNDDLKVPLVVGAGYLSSFSYSEHADWLFVASELEGNTALPVGDNSRNQTTGNTGLCHGGAFNNNLNGGLFHNNIIAITTCLNIIGARLIYIPQPEEVTAND